MKTIVNKLPESNIISLEQIPSANYSNVCFIAIKKGIMWGIIRANKYIANFDEMPTYCYLETPIGFTRGPDKIEEHYNVSIKRYIKFLLEEKYEILMFDDFYEMISWISKEKPVYNI